MAYVTHSTIVQLTPTVGSKDVKLDPGGSAPTGSGIGTFSPWYLTGERGFGEPRMGDSITIVNPRIKGFNGPQRATGNYRPLVAYAQSPPTRTQGV